MFLVNSRLGIILCGPAPRSSFEFVAKLGRWKGQTLLLTYGRFFAEFLEDLSLVRLGLLALNTCVGLRYGSRIDERRSFSWKRAPRDSL